VKKIPYSGLVHKSKNHPVIHPKGALKKLKNELIIHINNSISIFIVLNLEETG
jgi:hypothetical protein